MKKKGYIFRRGEKAPKTINIRLLLKESQRHRAGLPLLHREETVCVKLSTSYAGLKNIARVYLQLEGAVQLWLLDETTASLRELELDDNHPISKAVSENSSIHVQEIRLSREVAHPSWEGSTSVFTSPFMASYPPLFAPGVASLCRASSSTKTSVHDQRCGLITEDEELAWALAEEINEECQTSQNDSKGMLNSTTIEGTCSQFSVAGGRSACTTICLYAVAQLLPQMDEAPRCLSSDTLDSFIQLGVVLYRDLKLQQEHTNIVDLWTAPAFGEIVLSLDRGHLIYGCTSKNDFLKCLNDATDFAALRGKLSVAIIITKPPETILMICKDINQHAPWFLFDSHGQQSKKDKNGYIVQLDTKESATDALFDKFPAICGLDEDSLCAQQLNMFEACPIVLRDREVDLNTNPLAEDPPCHVSAAKASPRDVPPASRIFAKNISHDKAAVLVGGKPSVVRSSAELKQPPKADFEGTDLFRDRITGELFADPVFCDRGHTHERACIEHHFQSRREQKAEYEQRQQEQGSAANANADSCRRATNFDPTCPFTGEAVSEILIENDQCDKTVALLVESGLVLLDDKELENWQQRRTLKAGRLARNRAAAVEQRCQKEAQQQTSALPAQKASGENVQHQTSPQSSRQHMKQHPQQGMLTAELVGGHHPFQPSENGQINLDLAISLCPTSFKSSIETAVLLRCSNPCCRSQLTKGYEQSCSRCAQAFCSDCLIFQVSESNSENKSNPEELHSICPECTWQITDGLASRDEPPQEKVQNLGDMMSTFFAELCVRKSHDQEQVVQHEKQVVFNKVSQRLEDEIQTLGKTKEALDWQVQSARRQAKIAQDDQGNVVPILSTREEELHVQIADLEVEYNNIDGSKEQNILRYSLIEYELNEAKMDLAIIESLKENSGDEVQNTTEEEIELANKCEAVMREHDQLESSGPANGNELLSLELIALRENNAEVKDQTEASTPKVRFRNIAFSCGNFVVGLVLALVSGNFGVNQASGSASSDAEDDETFQVDATMLSAITSNLLAISQIGLKTGPLPLNLNYPSSRMSNQVLLLLNDLQGKRLQLERELDVRYLKHQRVLEIRVEALQDDIATIRHQVADAETAAAEEVKLRDERIRRNQVAEQERVEIERKRAAEERHNRREKERLEELKSQQEEQTRQSLIGQDLRCCGKCGYGPVTKFNCNDMAAHNHKIYVMDENGRRRQRRCNECPACGWFDSQWRNWPKFQMKV